MNAETDFRLSLAPYQQRAVDAIAETLRTVSEIGRAHV